MNLKSHVSLVMLSHATNAAYWAGLFDPEGANGSVLDDRGQLFSTTIEETMPMRVWLSGWYRDEARITAAAWPPADVDDRIRSSPLGARQGEVVASGWLCRGGHLHLSTPLTPSIFLSVARREDMKLLRKPNDWKDPLRLYPSFLTYHAA